ncbi:MAG TPA: hypothetical protein VF752_10875 [Thermoleophilaceae bacterium]
MAGYRRWAPMARRGFLIALEAKRRWDRLPEHEKQRYIKMARDYAQRGRALGGVAMKRGRDLYGSRPKKKR